LGNSRKLISLDVSDTALAWLDVSNCQALTYLDCTDSLLTFSTLPFPSTNYLTYDYSNQKEMRIASAHAVGRTMNLSSEYSIFGTLTEYTWFYADGTLILQS
jgi:hypothetical protein